MARRLVAVAVGLARRQRALRPRQQPHGLLAVARLRQRDAGQRPAARGGDRRLHRVRALGGPQRQRGRLGRIAVGERDSERACSTHASASGSSSPATVSSPSATHAPPAARSPPSSSARARTL